MEKMHFTRMDEGTDADFQVLRNVHEQTLSALPDRLFDMLRDLAKDTAYSITRYDHCLQTATRALRDGKMRTTSRSPCCTTPASRSARSITVK